jgi:hypothetical protein
MMILPRQARDKHRESSKKVPFSSSRQSLADRASPRERCDTNNPQTPPSTKRAFFEFSLCLSRACLGKMMHFIYKWLKKPVFLPLDDFEFKPD